jgi:hypothetical protein
METVEELLALVRQLQAEISILRAALAECKAQEHVWVDDRRF